MAEFKMHVAQHDETICQEIGAAAGQTDWPIEHRQEGGEVVLTLPDGVLTQAQFDGVLSAHVAPSPPGADMRDSDFRTALGAATTVPQIKRALLDWIGDE